MLYVSVVPLLFMLTYVNKILNHDQFIKTKILSSTFVWCLSFFIYFFLSLLNVYFFIFFDSLQNEINISLCTFIPQSQHTPNSPDSSRVDGPERFDSVDEEPSQSITSHFRQFYESKLGALSVGLAVGSLAVFIALRIYRATKS